MFKLVLVRSKFSDIDGNMWHYLKPLDRSDGLYELKVPYL
jgi:hypothetical protein